MANQFTETKQEKDEFSRIFNDYRSKVDEITRQMQKNLGYELPEPEPEPPVIKPEDIVIEIQTRAELEPEEMFPGIQEEPEQEEEISPDPQRPEPVMVKESDEIIREAKKNASRIIAEAEKRIKDEAKKKTEIQVNKIITQAQKEAQAIIARARQYTEDQKTEAINALKQQVLQSIDEIVESCRQETYEQSSLIIRESQDKAAKIINDILDAAREMGTLLEEAVTNTNTTINDFEGRIKASNESLLQALSQSQNKFVQITTVTAEEKPKEPRERKAEPEPRSKRKETKSSSALAIRLMPNNQDFRGDGLFRGKIEVKSVSSTFDYTYLKNLRKFLTRLPAVKCLQESASEKAVTMIFDVNEQLPVLEVLRKIPLVDEVISETGENIWLTFKNPDQS
jgi:F0F1-type ATP synthase membrane subunit b/b'